MKASKILDPRKDVSVFFEIFNGLDIHSYVPQIFRLHYYNAHLHNLHWNARFLYFSAFPFFLLLIAKSSTDSTSDPLIYALIITFYFPLISQLIKRGGSGNGPLLLSMHTPMESKTWSSMHKLVGYWFCRWFCDVWKEEKNCRKV